MRHSEGERFAHRLALIAMDVDDVTEDAGETADADPQTRARGDSDDTAVVDNLPTTLGPELAWSQDDSSDQAHGRSWRRALVIAVVICGIGGVTALAITLWPHRTPPKAATTPSPVTSMVTATARPPDPVREQNFLAALQNLVDSGRRELSYADIPGSHGAYMGDPTAWLPSGAVVRNGYKACAVMAQYPNDRKRATDVLYRSLGFGMEDLTAANAQARKTYMDIAEVDLCD